MRKKSNEVQPKKNCTIIQNNQSVTGRSQSESSELPRCSGVKIDYRIIKKMLSIFDRIELIR